MHSINGLTKLGIIAKIAMLDLISGLFLAWLVIDNPRRVPFLFVAIPALVCANIAVAWWNFRNREALLKEEPRETLLARGAGASRTLGWVYVGGLICWLLTGDYKRLPIWLSVCAVSVSSLLIWSKFRRAKRFKAMSSKPD